MPAFKGPSPAFSLFRLSGDAAVATGGKKEGNAARHVWTDLRAQRLEILSKQGPDQDRHDDQVKEESRGCCKVLRGEGRQRAERVRLGQLAQEPGREVSAALPRRAADDARQIGKAAHLGNSQPHQPDPVAGQIDFKLNQLLNMAAVGAVSGTFWGALIGLIFLMPLAGAALGAASGVIGGALTDVLVRKVTADKVLEGLKGEGGAVLKTSLDHTKQAALQAALAGVRAAVPAGDANPAVGSPA